MESLTVSTQTLEQFLVAPFYQQNNQRQLRYEDRYQAYKKMNRIKIAAVCEVEKDYFILVKVPSESNKGNYSYDVVIQFTPPDDHKAKAMSLDEYWVQFFSNSPGFVYKYAALYKLQGYLIETLQYKFTAGVLDTLPDKANKNYDLYYDSSIYYACRYLQDHKLDYMSKIGLIHWKRPKFDQFVSSISSFEDSEISRQVTNLEGSIKQEMRKDRKLSITERHKLESRNKLYQKQLQKKDSLEKKVARLTTSESDEPKIIRAKNSTSEVSRTVRVKPNPKKRATKSTAKKK